LSRDKRGKLRLVRCVASAWLVVQLLALAAAPFAVCAHATEHAGAHNMKCCPGILPGQICPMHHEREGGRTCTMTSPCRGADAALVSLLAFAGAVPLAPASIAPAMSTVSFHLSTTTPIARSTIPDPPPPRA
jgi:hypothetical protein